MFFLAGSPPPIPPKDPGLLSNFCNSQHRSNLNSNSSYPCSFGSFRFSSNSSPASLNSFASYFSSHAKAPIQNSLCNPNFPSDLPNMNGQTAQKTDTRFTRPDNSHFSQPSIQSAICSDGRLNSTDVFVQPKNKNFSQQLPACQMAKKQNSDLIDLSFWDRDDTSPHMADVANDMHNSILDIFDPLIAVDSSSSAAALEFSCDNSSTKDVSLVHVTTPPPCNQVDAGNPWLVHDDVFEMPDPFDLEALQKASELAKMQAASSVCEEEKCDSGASSDCIKRQRNLQNTLKYRVSNLSSNTCVCMSVFK